MVAAADCLAIALGRGLVAGAAATAAMTVSSTVEMRGRGRAPSTVPVEVAGRLLGVQPLPDGDKRFGALAHVLAGVSLGVTRGLLDLVGPLKSRARVAFFLTAWSPDLVAAPAAGAAPAPWRWGAPELVISALHHAVYAIVGDRVYRALSGRSRQRR